jgi:hypothetical protein
MEVAGRPESGPVSADPSNCFSSLEQAQKKPAVFRRKSAAKTPGIPAFIMPAGITACLLSLELWHNMTPITT